MTAYIVLREGDAIEGKVAPWLLYHSEVDAADARDAIRKACDGDDVAAGRYVAVPARSWRPVTVEAVQTTVLKLS